MGLHEFSNIISIQINQRDTRISKKKSSIVMTKTVCAVLTEKLGFVVYTR